MRVSETRAWAVVHGEGEIQDAYTDFADAHEALEEERARWPAETFNLIEVRIVPVEAKDA